MKYIKRNFALLKNYILSFIIQRFLARVPSCHIGGEGEYLHVDWGEGAVSQVSSIWLRDNSPGYRSMITFYFTCKLFTRTMVQRAILIAPSKSGKCPYQFFFTYYDLLGLVVDQNGEKNVIC